MNAQVKLFLFPRDVSEISEQLEFNLQNSSQLPRTPKESGLIFYLVENYDNGYVSKELEIRPELVKAAYCTLLDRHACYVDLRVLVTLLDRAYFKGRNSRFNSKCSI